MSRDGSGVNVQLVSLIRSIQFKLCRGTSFGHMFVTFKMALKYS